MTGKLLQMAFAIFSILARILSVLLFLAPSLGLANLLMHWKMGKLTVIGYSDLVFDVQNGTDVFFKDVWIPTPKYTSFTLWELETYYIIFLGLIPLHLALVFGLKHLLAFGFRYAQVLSIPIPLGIQVDNIMSPKYPIRFIFFIISFGKRKEQYKFSIN
jgi:hypothetical protein